MLGDWRVGVVIPAKNEQDFIEDVISGLPDFVDCVVVVNDGSTDNTRNIVEQNCQKSEKITLLNKSGVGVGAAIDAGHQQMRELLSEPFVSAVMAGDGQMNPEDLASVVKPIINGQADYVKGNRFIEQNGPKNMPRIRIIASMILGFFTTLAAGRRVTDPQCGFTAISHHVIQEWSWEKSWRGYGYPNYWLIELSKKSFRVIEVPVKCIYGAEKSGIKMLPFFISVGFMMAVMHHKRCLAMLFSRSVTPHTLLSFMAYVIGWVALIPGVTTDLESALTDGFISTIFFVLVCWASAHVFDRLSVRMRTELRYNAQT